MVVKTMEVLMTKAQKKAVKALKKELARRDDYGYRELKSYVNGGYMHRIYFREYWKAFFKLASKEFGEKGCNCRTIDELVQEICMYAHGECAVKCLRAWAEICLPHNTFRVLEAEGCLHIVASSMDGFPVTMPAKKLIELLLAYDEYSAKIDIEALMEQAVMEVSVEAKSRQMLTQTASLLIEDILKTEQFRFDVRMQKNGRLCCTIHKWASWMPNKVFRTSFETFREDFIEAYKDFKRRNSVCYYL